MSTLLAAERTEMPSLRFGFLLPGLAALCYPLLLLAISYLLARAHVAIPPSPAVIALSVFAILVVVVAVFGVAFAQALALGRSEPANTPARILAHLSFAAPSLLTGFGNIAGLLHARAATIYAWIAFWLVMMLVSSLARDPARPAVTQAPARRRLATAHGISAMIILLLFILPHLGNHLAGIVSGSAHIAVMKAVRQVYRGEIGEPILLALICFQLVSGFVLVKRKLEWPSDIFGTIQTVTGIYVGIYLLGHMLAALAARGAGTDTNWNWLSDNDRGLLDHLSSFSLVGHYWVGPIAIIAHLACGLRVVMLEHGASMALASRLASILIGAGAVASSIILAGLLGVHIA